MVTNRILLSDQTDNYADVMARVRDQSRELLDPPVGSAERSRRLEASAKIRTGQPIDDEEDYELPIWAGVIPVRMQVLPPEPDPRNPEESDGE